MTARFTKAEIRRVVEAVSEAKVSAVIEIAPEGTIRIRLGQRDDIAEPEPETDNEWDEVLL